MFHCLSLLDTEEEKDFLRKIFETYKDEMFYTAYVILENKQDAEDIVQDTLLALIPHLSKMKKEPPQKNWNFIVTIVKNNSFNRYKKKKRQADRELPITEEILKDIVDVEFDTKVLEIEQRDFVGQLLGQMSELHQDILLVRYYHELSTVEIGELLGKSPDTVRHIIHRAKKKLQGMLEGEEVFGSS